MCHKVEADLVTLSLGKLPDLKQWCLSQCMQFVLRTFVFMLQIIFYYIYIYIVVTMKQFSENKVLNIVKVDL